MTPISIKKVTVAAATLLYTSSLTTLAIPLTYDIARRETECLYDKLKPQEHATIAVTILAGATLTGTATIAGPFAQLQMVSAGQLYDSAQKYYKNMRNRNSEGQTLFETYSISYEQVYNGDDDYDDDDVVYNDDDIDWDDDDMDDVSFQDYYYDMDDDDDFEYMFMEDDAMDDTEITQMREKKAEYEKLTPEEKLEQTKEKRERNAAQAKDALAKRKERKAKRDVKKASLNKRDMTDKERQVDRMKSGEAFMATHQISSAGWYMVCLEATSNQVKAEIEFRKSSEVGLPNRKTGHLQTYERHEMVVKEKKLFGDGIVEAEQRKLDAELQAKKLGDQNLPIPDALKEKDLENSKTQITKLNRVLNDIKQRQQNERNRISIHAALNEHSHSRMVLSSLFETVFYIAVSGFQVYTIRKWFRGNPILGY